MTDDLRKQRSESPEGKGLARRAWVAYTEAFDRARPEWVDRMIGDASRRWTEQLLGFWVAWHLYGGFEGLRRAGWSERTIYRRLKEFRLVFKTHPDSFRHPGVTLDPQAFWEWYRTSGDEE